MNQILRRAIEQRTDHKALERVLKARRELGQRVRQMASSQRPEQTAPSCSPRASA
jgi:acetolactate synthase regulatory subunit